MNLTYPQQGIIPSVAVEQPSLRQIPFLLRSMGDVMSELRLRYSSRQTLSKRDREASLDTWKRDLSSRANGTIDPWVCGSHINSCERCLTGRSMGVFSLMRCLITPSTSLFHGVSMQCTVVFFDVNSAQVLA